MTRFQRVLLGVTAGVVAVRLVTPATYFTRVSPDLPATLQQIFAVVAVAAGLFVLIPFLNGPVVSLAASIPMVMLAGFAGFHFWEQHQERNTKSPAYAVVEGQRFGILELGMPAAEVRRRLNRPVSDALKVAEGVVEDWDEPQGRWIITFGRQDTRAIAIGYVLYAWDSTGGDIHQWAARVQYETTNGGRFGQDTETVKALYGEPSKSKFDEEGPYAALPPMYPMSYYYDDLGIEFGFVCTLAVPTAKDCRNHNAYAVDEIFIWTPGSGPPWTK
jgi:hypothetical protein